MINTISRHSKLIAVFFLVIISGESAFAFANSLNMAEKFPVENPRMDFSSPLFKEEIKKKFTTENTPDSVLNSKTDPINKVNKSREEEIIEIGPGQPEMSSFSSVNSNNMVDLFSGDFSYNIPLLDVGGYPVNLAYRGGISMDQEASWVGLGWNINPGTITRNLRGLPDDFDGNNDSITKTNSIKINKTIGVNIGADFENLGVPLSPKVSLGVFHNNYKGWGLERSLNVSISSGSVANTHLTAGLSLTNNTQEGYSISPSLALNLVHNEDNELNTFSFSASLPYNSRAGLRGLQLSAGLRQYRAMEKDQHQSGSGNFSSMISFASPTHTPSISMPFTSQQFTFNGKVGGEIFVAHPTPFIGGYVSKQFIAKDDQIRSLPAFGYLNFHNGALNKEALMDYNREKEIAYREKPAVPHIAVPFYTYDAFSISGEGTGGMFRAYRGDIGFVFDHAMRTKDLSAGASIDLGIGNVSHWGVDLGLTRAFSQSGPWIGENPLAKTIEFKSNKANFEAVYFRNPGEKSVNSKQFYETLGGDDVVTVELYQPNSSSPGIQTTNYLRRYRNKNFVGKTLLTPENVVKPERDKRTQVISYLNAKEASTAAFSKYIESYAVNNFSNPGCVAFPSDVENGPGTGLIAEYFPNMELKGIPSNTVTEATVFHPWGSSAPFTGFPGNKFSVRWTGRIKAPVTGSYTFTTFSDDGARLWINDSLVLNHWYDQSGNVARNVVLNLLQGEMYKIRLEVYENKKDAKIEFKWSYPGQSSIIIPQTYLYPPSTQDVFQSNNLTREKRINSFRKENHLSEITVLNNDGRRYVYGIPVYNLKQKDATFSVKSNGGNQVTGLVKFDHGLDNTTDNNNGKENYFLSEEVPAYAHSFLLSAIVSPDYSDLTGNGISDDDLGDAVKFNYSKIAGIDNPYRWRIPYVQDSVTFNEGMRTDTRDDKGSYVYGEKEMWYLHSIESKSMVATFVLDNRLDLLAATESGEKINDNTAKLLKEIRLYSKADLATNPATARPIKTVHFEYSYELCKGMYKPVHDSGKLTLKKVWFSYNGNNKGQQNPYVFNYNSHNPDYNIKSYDRWGNYKNPLDNPGSSSLDLITNAEYPYSLQDSVKASINAAAWSLDSIYLPSGGSIKVAYESDDYAYVQNKRAMQLFKIRGLGYNEFESSPSSVLYTQAQDNLFVYIDLTEPVLDKEDFKRKYLEGIKKFYFRLSVKMPDDNYNGNYDHEYVSCYSNLDSDDSYGIYNSTIAWIKLEGISLKGDGPGDYSPLAKAAIQFLRLNLPSKAYPGSEVGDNIDLYEAVAMLASFSSSVFTAFNSFDRTARQKFMARIIDPNRSFVRLNNPVYKKIGGGQRVKRITIYDNWDKMTGQRAAKYGQEYTYTTSKEIDGEKRVISSGVASYEPALGGEENPFHQPIEYVEKISVLGPVSMSYSEEPLGESLFPSAGIGYSKIRVRTINYKDKRSANGYDETMFYTAYDFPVFTDRTMIDSDTKKRFKPGLANFLRINARHFLSLSQGFKIELNDMHGKLRAQASYSETDPINYINYTENIYKVENPHAEHKRLSNTVMVMRPDGTIDEDALIGKEVELMMDMREQKSITNANNLSLNSELFSAPFIPPFFLIPTALTLAQREENRFRSVATTKVVQRYGILDSVIQIDKGSKITSRDLLYDSETGNVLLNRTQNEFNDPMYSFNFPSHWAYDGMGLAYKNINVILDHLTVKEGKIVAGLGVHDSTYFSNGDEILVYGKQKTGTISSCNDAFASFAGTSRIWAVDRSTGSAGPKDYYFIDNLGVPFSGQDVTMKIIRSGRRNILASVASVTTLVNPLVWNAGSQEYTIELNTSSQVIAASAVEYSDKWHRNANCAICSGTLNGSNCIHESEAEAGESVEVCAIPGNVAYSSCGTYIYDDYNDVYPGYLRRRLASSNPFWVNSDDPNQCGYTPAEDYREFVEPVFPREDTCEKEPVPSSDGPLNRCGIWLCPTGNTEPLQEWIGINTTFEIPKDDVYYIGMAGDNRIRVYIDGVLFKEDDGTIYNGSGVDYYNPENFKIWHIYPVELTEGIHSLKIEAYNDGCDAAFGLEIYYNTEEELAEAADYENLNIIFSTKDLDGQSFPMDYSCPEGYSLVFENGEPLCRKIESAVTFDNPVSSGIFGNWRSLKSYVYYSTRTTNNPAVPTDIRRDGTFNDFASFWQFDDEKLVPVYNDAKWVWNSEVTQFNRRGLEVENKDALNRYNSGLYGYGLTLPVAVAQNSKARESAFEGFEDYNFSTGALCDDACSDIRHIDFSLHSAKISSNYKHTGKASLRLTSWSNATVSASLKDSLSDRAKPSMTIGTTTNTCYPGENLMTGISYTNDNQFSQFSPSKGKKMVVSAWVREEQECNCTSYNENRIIISFQGSSTSYTFQPSGPIIEGWQRYESIFEIPAGATAINVILKANDAITYFDDLRIHPFNSNMKSFVYHPVNLRLMAELDENNYATIYEYDEDGTLVRVKKETERGIKTIRETRSALLKDF